MTQQRIAVLFDAENTPCSTAGLVLEHLGARGAVQSASAVGDFSILPAWLACARHWGIDLVMQPSLGKGKNAADIRLAIEAMDLAQRGRIDALALVTQDRDFTPLAFRLRESGIAVFGFSQSEPNPAFRAACSSFTVLQAQAHAAPHSLPLSAGDIEQLARIAARVCAGGDTDHAALTHAVRTDAPLLATKLSGRFLKTLIAHGVVQRVGTGPQQRLRRAG